jgi:RluA family pseudouridine synthase
MQTHSHRKRGNRGEPQDLILWLDDALVAVNKPAGLPTTAGGYHPEPNLLSRLEPEVGALWVVHRLDRHTSGIVVLARTAEAHRALNTQFQERRVLKVYHALAQGGVPWTEKSLDLPLRPDGDRRHRTVVAQAASGPRSGKPSVTLVRVLQRFAGYTLVEAVPKTGRTHQIRAHLSAVGLPIVGDVLYGGEPALFLSAIKPGYRPSAGPERPLLDRVALHALLLALEHPVSHEPLRLEAPYPKDFAAALRQLGRWAAPG